MSGADRASPAHSPRPRGAAPPPPRTHVRCRSLLVIDRIAKHERFYVDDAGPTTAAAAIRRFLVPVAAGRLRGEYAGMWGFPARTWRRLIRWVPPLRALDWLPQWSFVCVLCPFALYLLVQLLLWEPTPQGKGEKQS